MTESRALGRAKLKMWWSAWRARAEANLLVARLTGNAKEEAAVQARIDEIDRDRIYLDAVADVLTDVRIRSEVPAEEDSDPDWDELRADSVGRAS